MWLDEMHSCAGVLAPARAALWPALAGAATTLVAAVRDGRRRAALNQRLHEVRRPLQALALMAARDGGGRGDEGSIEMAAAALARLELEINGARGTGARALIAVRPLLEATRRRWHPQAVLRGAGIELRWRADEAVVEGDRIELAAALDNLVANALEHGGPRIELVADSLDGRLCLAVVDSGSGAGRRARERDAVARGRAGRRRPQLRAPLRRWSGRARHGHGLALVSRTAARHRGTFALHRGERGTSAVLELPLALARPAGRSGIVVRRERGRGEGT